VQEARTGFRIGSIDTISVCSINNGDDPHDQSDALGVHSLDHIALVVPDLAKASDFYSAFGLDVHAERQFMGSTHSDLPSGGSWSKVAPSGCTICRSEYSKRTFRASKALDKQVCRFSRRRRQLPATACGSATRWHVVELKVAQKTSPPQKSSPNSHLAPGNGRRTEAQQAPLVRPARLAHCLVFTRSVPEALSFTAVLWDCASRIAPATISLHARSPCSDHHLIAFARSHAPGLHHCAWTFAR